MGCRITMQARTCLKERFLQKHFQQNMIVVPDSDCIFDDDCLFVNDSKKHNEIAHCCRLFWISKPGLSWTGSRVSMDINIWF